MSVPLRQDYTFSWLPAAKYQSISPNTAKRLQSCPPTSYPRRHRQNNTPICQIPILTTFLTALEAEKTSTPARFRIRSVSIMSFRKSYTPLLGVIRKWWTYIPQQTSPAPPPRSWKSVSFGCRYCEIDNLTCSRVYRVRICECG